MLCRSLIVAISLVGCQVAQSNSGLATAISFDPNTASYSFRVTLRDSRILSCPSSNGTAQTDFDLLPRLKDVFKQASHLLYRATKHHAHIGQVTFFLPEHWPLDNFSESVECVSCENDKKCNGLSKIQILPKVRGEWNQAVVRNTANCGEEAEGPMEISSRLLGCSKLSKAAKVFVHEFAHLRYGVYDEYSRSDLRHAPLCPSSRAATNTTASLMASIDRDEIVDFCDNSGNNSTRHDPSAFTQQNIHCSKRSVWEVLRSHEDFSNFVEPSPTKKHKKNEELEPTFKFVRRCSGESVVFVVDKNFNNGIEVAETVSSIQDYIENFTTNFTHAAIITFGGHQLVNKTHRLLTTTESGRVRLFEMLRRVRSARETDSSNAQSALKKAIRLAKSVSTSERSVIFLSASDNGRLASGLSCEKLQVHRRHDKLVPVHVFAFSSSAERFERCAQNSNGHYYRVQNQASFRYRLQQLGRRQRRTVIASTKKVTLNSTVSGLVLQSAGACSNWSSTRFIVHGSWHWNVSNKDFCKKFRLYISGVGHRDGEFSTNLEQIRGERLDHLISSLHSEQKKLCSADVPNQRTRTPFKYTISNSLWKDDDIVKVEVTAKRTAPRPSCLARQAMDMPDGVSARTTPACKELSLTNASQILLKGIENTDFMFLLNITAINNNHQTISFKRSSPMFGLRRRVRRAPGHVKQFYKFANRLNTSRFCSDSCSPCTKLSVGETYVVTVKRDKQCERSDFTINGTCNFVLGKQSTMLPWKCSSSKRQPCGIFALMRVAAIRRQVRLNDFEKADNANLTIGNSHTSTSRHSFQMQ